MKIYTEIIGNLQDPEWVKKAREAEIEYIDLDQWTAQKSRFVVKGDRENEYAVALKRHSQMLDGDIIEYLPEQRRIADIRIRLNDGSGASNAGNDHPYLGGTRSCHRQPALARSGQGDKGLHSADGG